MGEEFYAIIKLVSGEEIMSLVMAEENEEDDVLLVLQNPVIMHMHMHNHGHYIKVKPWMDLTDEDFFIIKLDKIITMTETKDKKLINVYNNYITDMNESNTNDTIHIHKTSGKIKPNSNMGYLSSVENARKNLEELFKFKPNKES